MLNRRVLEQQRFYMCPNDTLDNDRMLATSLAVRNNIQAAKDVISQNEGAWGIIRLANHASISGEGYGWEIKDFDHRDIEPKLCYSGTGS